MNPDDVLSQFYPGGFFGNDIDGRPIFIEPLGRIDFYGLLNSMTAEDILNYKREYAKEMHMRCQTIEKELGKTFEKRGVLLLDAEGGNTNHLWRPGLTLYKSILDMIDEEFPTLHYRVLIINTPFIFPTIWSFLKPFLSTKQKERAIIFGRNWKEELQKYVDVSTLPVHYGGKCVDKKGSPKCEELICYGGTVPRAFYLKNMNQIIKRFDGFEHFNLKPNTFHHIKREAGPKCTSFKYQFVTCIHQVLFSVFVDENGRLECVLKETEYEKLLLHEESIIRQRKRGVYVFQFCLMEDATFSDTIFFTISECSNDI